MEKFAKKNFIFVLFLFLVQFIFSPPVESEDTVLSAFLYVLDKSEIKIKNFSISNSIFYANDANVEFHVKILNQGNRLESVNSTIVIFYYYNDTLAKEIPIGTRTLIAGEEQNQIIYFDHNDLSPNKYVAMFTIEYGNNTKKNSSLDFTILPQTTVQPISSGTGGGGFGVSFIGKRPLPDVTDKIKTVQEEGIEEIFTFVGGTSFTEIYKRERGYLVTSIKSKLETPLILFIDYPEDQFLRFTGPNKIIIQPFENTNILIPFDFPSKDEKAGYYLTELKFRAQNQTKTFQSLINLKKEENKPFLIKRSSIWNKEQNVTTLYLEIKSNLDKKINFLEVYKQAPKEFFSKIDFDLLPANSKVNRDKNELWFGLNEIRPNETYVLQLKIKLSTYLPILDEDFKISKLLFYKEQLDNVYNNKKKLYLEKIPTSAFKPGEKKIIKLNLMNNDQFKKEVNLNFIPPPGWFSSIQKSTLILEPREIYIMDILIGAPEDIKDGDYFGLLKLTYQGEFEEESIKFQVKTSDYVIFVPITEPIEIKFLELKTFLLVNKEIIGGLLFVVFGLGAYYFLQQKKIEKRMKESSMDYLNKVREILERNKS